VIIAYDQAKSQRQLQYIAESVEIDAKKKKLLTLVQYIERVEYKRRSSGIDLIKLFRSKFTHTFL
jgi:hypothetical protein